MFRNVHYDYRKSKIHLWEQINGKNLYDVIDWVPYVFYEAPEGELSTIYGQSAKKITFNKYFDYKEYCKNRILHENSIKPEIQFLVDRYQKIPDEDLAVPTLRVMYFDIEVVREHSNFPDPYIAEDPIVLISVLDSITNKITTFGLADYSDSSDDRFVKCSTEELLLMEFLKYMHKADYDVLSGWHIAGFDIPFIVNRAKRLFGAKNNLIGLLSPINEVREWRSNAGYINYDIAGVTFLDYLDTYRKYCHQKLPSYSLQAVSSYELGTGKLDYSKVADSFATLYKNDFNLAVQYNKMDVRKVKQLEDKLGFINMIQTLSMFSKCPMKYCHSQTAVIEGALLTNLRRQNKCAPPARGGRKKDFEAAIVKVPQVGMFSWVVDFDVTSQYPTAIITLNMSNETYLFRILELTEKEIVKYSLLKNFPDISVKKMFNGEPTLLTGDKLKSFNNALKTGAISISPNGIVFKTAVKGFIADLERNLFEERKKAKNLMIAYKKKGNLYKAAKYSNLQVAIKTVLNSIYGSWSVPYSRYFNQDIAEAITSCGRLSLLYGMMFINQISNNLNDRLIKIFKKIGFKQRNTEQKDFVLYGDTDSCFVSIEEIIKHHCGLNVWSTLDDNEKLTYCKQISNEIVEYLNDKAYTEIQKKIFNSKEDDFKLNFKQEIIAKAGLFVAKKKYSLHVIDEEGAACDKIHTKGLEIIQSSCPSAVKEKLSEIVNFILRNIPIEEKILQYAEELKTALPEDIALNIGVQAIEKYVDEHGLPKKGCPYHVKGILAYRNLIEELNLTGQYEVISTGNKAKTVYLKPNKWNYDTVTFYIWPKEFEEHGIEVDYDKMIDKTFLKKIKSLTAFEGDDEEDDM